MQDPDELLVLSVTTTVGSLEAARALAKRILDEKRAACVQLDSAINSLYRWQGELHDEPEVRLVIKTLPACEEALRELFARHHPYEVPQFLSTAMRASAAYVQWVREQVVVPPA
ncbi:MAG: divalent-cation tolerance protein CutA [Ramlibacter sp.]